MPAAFAVSLPLLRTTELVSWISGHFCPLMTEHRSDTGERLASRKRPKNQAGAWEKQRRANCPWKWQVQQIKNPAVNLRLSALEATLNFKSKYKLKQGKIWVWIDFTLPTRVSETFLDILEEILSRQKTGSGKMRNHMNIPLTPIYIYIYIFPSIYFSFIFIYYLNFFFAIFVFNFFLPPYYFPSYCPNKILYYFLILIFIDYFYLLKFKENFIL